MSRYGVTKIRFGEKGIERFMLHHIDLTGENEFSLGDGVDTPASEVASRIHDGDRVTVLVDHQDGTFDQGPDVICAPGTDDLVPIEFMGSVKISLADLPEY